MKKTHYIIGLLSILIATVNNCSDSGIRSQSPVVYEPEKVIKDENGSVYLNVSGVHFSVMGKKINELAESRYLDVEKSSSVESDKAIESDLKLIEMLVAEKYNIKIVSDDYAGDNKMVRTRDGISVMALLDENFTFDKSNFLVSYPYDLASSKDRQLHIVKEDNGSFVIKKEFEFDYSFDAYRNEKLQLDNIPYILIAGDKNNLIPIVDNNTVDFYSINEFVTTFYESTYDYEAMIFNYRSVLVAFYLNDGAHIVYDVEKGDADSKIKYHYIPFDSPQTPTVLNVPLWRK